MFISNKNITVLHLWRVIKSCKSAEREVEVIINIIQTPCYTISLDQSKINRKSHRNVRNHLFLLCELCEAVVKCRTRVTFCFSLEMFCTFISLSDIILQPPKTQNSEFALRNQHTILWFAINF